MTSILVTLSRSTWKNEEKIITTIKVSSKLHSNVFFSKTFGGVNTFRDANYTVLSTLFLHSLDLGYKPDHMNYIKIRYINMKIF